MTSSGCGPLFPPLLRVGLPSRSTAGAWCRCNRCRCRRRARSAATRSDAHDLALEPARALVQNGQELGRQLFKQLRGAALVDVPEPVLVLAGLGYFPVGPLARQVDAQAGHHPGLVLQAHHRQVEAVSSHEVRCLGQVFASPD